MKQTGMYVNERLVLEAFDTQSAVFDDHYTANTIIKYKRERVRQAVSNFLSPPASILELNAGTGEDAIYFAQQGFRVHATDISPGMQQMLKEKVNRYSLQEKVSTELRSFTQLEKLEYIGPFDLIFSNFAGLNCTNELEKVLTEFNHLLKPGGRVVLVVLPKFCLWEMLLVFKGKLKTATRRLFSSNGRKAKIEGVPFTCWYHSPGKIKKIMGDKFIFSGLEGLCTIVPPSYIEHFAEKHPRLFSWLRLIEEKLKKHWPWRAIGDYYIISFTKK